MGTCTWVIWSATQLWSGEGIVPSTTDNIYSGLAEAYGIYTVLQFFPNYINSFPIILPPSTSIKLYCNNQGVLDHLQCRPSPLYTCDTIQDDYPIFCEIQLTLHMLQPIKVQLFHVLGHQDTNKLKQPLTILETLNVDCNERASSSMTH